MKAGLVMMWGAALTLAGSAIAYTASRYASASAEASRASAECASVVEGLRDLASLRVSGEASAADALVSDEGLAETVSQTLAEVGLPPATLESLAPDLGPASGAPIFAAGNDRAGVTLRRAKASLVVQDLTLPRLGAFIDAFARRRPGWRVTNIDIARDRDAKVTPGEDLPLRAVMMLETLVVAEPGEERR